MTLPHRPRVLLVDDDNNIRQAFARALVQTFDITQAVDGAVAIEILKAQSYDAIETDLEMPNVGGDGLVAWLEANAPEMAKRVVVLSGGSAQPERAAWLRAFEPTRFLAKPCGLGDIVRAIGDAIDRAGK